MHIVDVLGTPLHLASANGHPDVVSLLVERKCKINLRDKHYQTSLMKAVQCQQEECARILLDYGADPALMDTHDNTALHYAASGLNTAIAAKLLRHTIDMEAKNKVEVYLLCEKIFSEIKCVNQEGCTPLLLAVKENNRDMVDLFLKNGANVNTSDRLDRTALMIAARCKPTGVVSLLLQYDIDLSCRDAFGQTAEEHAAFSGHSIHYELIYQYGQQKALNQPLSLQISSLERAADSRFTVTGPANDQEELIIDSNCCDANAITGSTPNYGFHSLIHILGSNKPIRFVGSCDDSLERHQNVKSIQPTTETHVYYTNDNLGNGVQEKRKSYLVEERNLDDSDDIDEFKGSSEESQESFDKSDLEQDTVQMDANNCDDLTQSSDTATEGDDLPALNYKNVLLVMEQLSVGCDDFIKLVKNEDAILRYDRSVVRKKGHCPLLTRKVKSLENKICGLREELSETRQMVSDLEQQKAEWKRELLSTRVPGKQEEIEQDAEEKLVLKMSHQFRKKERCGEKVELRQEFQYPLRTLDLELRTETNHSKQDEEELKETQGPLFPELNVIALQSGILNNPLSKQKENKTTASKITQTSEIPDSHEKEKYLFDKNQILEDENAMLKLEVDTLKIKNRDKENHIEILKEKNDYLHQKLQLNAEILTAIRVQYSEEARERNLQREVPVSGNYQAMRIVSQQVTSFYRRNYEEKEKLPKQVDETKSKVPVRNVKEKYLQEKNEIIQYEVAMHKVELKTVKIKDQRTRKHHREETEALKEKNEELQQELKWNREALRKIRFQYSGQVKVLKAENAALNSQLENAKENTERLESEIESYRSRLMSVIDDYEQSEASKLALEHSFQEARDEWLHVQDKLNSDLSSLRENHAFLSEELSQAESGAKSLENELGHVHESLREKTYIVENTQRELNHAEEKAKELEETNRVLKEKLSRCSLENESLQERLGQIQSENMVLQQALEDTQKKVTMKEKQLRDAQVQFIDLFKKLYADSEKQVLLVEESKKVLVSECNHFGEEMCKYEIEKAERGLGH
ncbi:ankyrin repeat domain-containing protein 26-like [Notamacropus eugenii]|uniref:ankyrin repeat domain-containing protein 26-like n=1 Tax=Notamacropus eugenii TaxID=9315 RepID=UPI003B6761E2